MSIAATIMAGGGRPRSPDAISTFAKSLDVEEAVIAAIVEVESSGRGFDGAGRVRVLFEKHHFHRHLPAAKRAEATREGLARPNFIRPQDGGYRDQPNNGAALGLLVRAMAIDETAALLSASYGLGQVLGSNFALAGYPTVQDFVLAQTESEDRHIHAMLSFMVGNGLIGAMRARDFDAIARVYNGPANVATYGARMRAAYARHAGRAATVEGAVSTMLRLGSRGDKVRALQQRLNELGYALAADGDFGPLTRRAVLAFQAEHGLTVDGIVGPQTLGALERAVKPEPSQPEAAPREVATAEDLRERGSRIIAESDKQEAVGVLVGVGAGLKALQEVGVVDHIRAVGEGVTALRVALEPLANVLEFAGDLWWLVALGLAGATFYLARQVKRARVEDHRTGKTV